MQDLLNLLKSKKFLPLFLTQFFTAFNDNVFKNALAIFIAYTIFQNSQILVTLVAFLFILPFFLFSAISGQVADKFNKAKIAQIVKISELLLVFLAIFGFYYKNITILMITIFAFGIHSAFFGPVKYGILPQIVDKNKIIAANGLVSSSTFIAILLGTIFGGLLILEENAIFYISFIMIFSALIGLISSYFIPKTDTNNFKISFNIFSQSAEIIKQTKQNHKIFLSIIAISWFWFIGACFLAQFANFTKDILHANNEVATALLAIFSIGIAFGSLICNILLKGKITSSYAPISLIFISLFIIDLYFASLALSVNYDEKLVGFFEFITKIRNIQILFDFFAIALFSGIYIVPLYSIIQNESSDKNRARTIASLNIFNSGFMVFSALFTIILLKFGFSILQIFLFIAFINFAIAFFVFRNFKKS